MKFFENQTAVGVSQPLINSSRTLTIQVDGTGTFELKVLGRNNQEEGSKFHQIGLYSVLASDEKSDTITKEGIYYPLSNQSIAEIKVEIVSINGSVSVYGGI